MSMAKQIFYHNLRKGNKTEVEIYDKHIKPYIKVNHNKWQKFSTFKWKHKREMDMRDGYERCFD